MVECFVRLEDREENLGRVHFAVAPRTGEYFTANDEKGQCQYYLVTHVVHATNQPDIMGDLIVKLIGSHTEFEDHTATGTKVSILDVL